MSTQLRNLDSFVSYRGIPVSYVFKSGSYYFLRVDTFLSKDFPAYELAQLTKMGLKPTAEFFSMGSESGMRIRITGSIPVSSSVVSEIKSARRNSRKISI